MCWHWRVNDRIEWWCPWRWLWPGCGRSVSLATFDSPFIRSRVDSSKRMRPPTKNTRADVDDADESSSAWWRMPCWRQCVRQSRRALASSALSRDSRKSGKLQPVTSHDGDRTSRSTRTAATETQLDVCQLAGALWVDMANETSVTVQNTVVFHDGLCQSHRPHLLASIAFFSFAIRVRYFGQMLSHRRSCISSCCSSVQYSNHPMQSPNVDQESRGTRKAWLAGCRPVDCTLCRRATANIQHNKRRNRWIVFSEWSSQQKHGIYCKLLVSDNTIKPTSNLH